SNNNEEEKEKLKAKILEFKNSTNIYQKRAYQEKELEIKQLLESLEISSTQIVNTQKQKPSFFRKEIIIPLSLGVVMLLAIGLIVIRKRRLKKIKSLKYKKYGK